jgi:hypothetical protein
MASSRSFRGLISTAASNSQILALVMIDDIQKAGNQVQAIPILGVEIEIEHVGPLMTLNLKLLHKLSAEGVVQEDIRETTRRGQKHGFGPNALFAHSAILRHRLLLTAEDSSDKSILCSTIAATFSVRLTLPPMLRTVKSEPLKYSLMMWFVPQGNVTRSWACVRSAAIVPPSNRSLSK